MQFVSGLSLRDHLLKMMMQHLRVRLVAHHLHPVRADVAGGPRPQPLRAGPAPAPAAPVGQAKGRRGAAVEPGLVKCLRREADRRHGGSSEGDVVAINHNNVNVTDGQGDLEQWGQTNLVGSNHSGVAKPIQWGQITPVWQNGGGAKPPWWGQTKSMWPNQSGGAWSLQINPAGLNYSGGAKPNWRSRNEEGKVNYLVWS